ncbi:MAG: transcriptional regulator [Candidatus Binatia bacterium]|nr:transcriptional regulator [Candidatus Binatia bacterium]
MFRKDFLTLLLNRPRTVADLAREFEVSPKDIASDLAHLSKTLRKSAYRLKVYPATCRKCGFPFSPEKMTKPGKCPQCKSTWIDDPLVEVIHLQERQHAGND